MKRFCLIIATLTFLYSFSATAQPVIQCGSTLEGEFAAGDLEHVYNIELSPGDILRISSSRVGDYLLYDIDVTSPSGDYIIRYDSAFTGTHAYESGSLSERGTYRIVVVSDGGFGQYSLYIGCTLGDGTVINPGDTFPVDQPQLDQSQSSAIAFSGIGFPGLAPVDFANVAKIPMIAGTPMTGAITPTGGEILGYTLDGAAGDTLDLTFTRLSGNLNLGLVVLSAENQVVFQASLVTSSTLNTRFTLPTAGTYTIGVFRIDLSPPATPEATAFQIQATLNP
jgi:hypothetical protein